VCEDTYRDNDKEMTYKVCALKVYIWQEVKQNNTPQRVTELQDMFLVGALDAKLVHACKILDPEFKPSHIPWVNKPNSEVTYDVSAALQAGLETKGLQEQALRGNFNLFVFELGKEAASYLKFKEAGDGLVAVQTSQRHPQSMCVITHSEHTLRGDMPLWRLRLATSAHCKLRTRRQSGMVSTVSLPGARGRCTTTCSMSP